jgi:hypothetical protein
MARYTALGFSAAAVTGLSMTMGVPSPPSEEGVERHAELRFGHPFAVVAVTTDSRWNSDAKAVIRGPWHGVPVFSAWVTDPMDPKDEPGEALEDVREPRVSRMRAFWSRVVGGGQP